jgi:hypothetical protein
MTLLTRRGFGIGLIGLATAGTAGALYWRESEKRAESNTAALTVTGFIGGEKEAFVHNPKVVELLAKHHDIAMSARRAGSVEQVRDRAILSQNPGFLWPSSSVMVDVAKRGGVKIKQDAVILNSPIVLYSWTPIADALVKQGIARQIGNGSYAVDAKRLINGLLAGESWKDLGVGALFGKARLQSTDPLKSNSGFMFAGLVANLLAGDVVDTTSLAAVLPDVERLFHEMGYKASSSGKLFDDYIAGGMGGAPLIVGYENQLVEWILADDKRWIDLATNNPVQPVTLYPEPTVLSAHPLIALTDDATKLIPALLDTEILAIAWAQHGFRGPLGRAGTRTIDALKGRMPPSISAILPMPDADAMLALIDHVGAG